jgi:hypothetical protein
LCSTAVFAHFLQATESGFRIVKLGDVGH